jgi:CheY-like chemotaxis protein
MQRTKGFAEWKDEGKEVVSSETSKGARVQSPRRIQLQGRILLGEPVPGKLREIARHLEELGLAVDAEPDPKAIPQRLRVGTPYDAVVLGHGPATHSGLQALQLIRAMRHQSGRIPVVMLTETGDEEHYEQCVFHGANEYLSVPVTKTALQEALRPHCGKLVTKRSGG